MIDLSHLKQLMGNDDQMVQRFLNIFQSQIPQQLTQLRQDIEEEYWESASNTAHAIKSQVKYLGLSDIADLAYEMEQNAEYEENLGEMYDLMTELEDLLQEVMREL